MATSEREIYHGYKSEWSDSVIWSDRGVYDVNKSEWNGYVIWSERRVYDVYENEESPCEMKESGKIIWTERVIYDLSNNQRSGSVYWSQRGVSVVDAIHESAYVMWSERCVNEKETSSWRCEYESKGVMRYDERQPGVYATIGEVNDLVDRLQRDQRLYL